MYDSRIKQLISKRKKLKKQAKVDKTNLKLQQGIVILNHKIDKKTAEFNFRLLQQKVNTDGNINKQEFWKLKCTLAPKSSIVPHAVLDNYGNEVTDIRNIQNAYLD